MTASVVAPQREVPDFTATAAAPPHPVVLDLAIAGGFSMQVPIAVAAETVSVEHAIRDFIVSRGVCEHVLGTQAITFRTVVAGAFAALTVPVESDRRTGHWIACLISHDPLRAKLRAEQDDIEQLFAPEAEDRREDDQQGPRRMEEVRSASWQHVTSRTGEVGTSFLPETATQVSSERQGEAHGVPKAF